MPTSCSTGPIPTAKAPARPRRPFISTTPPAIGARRRHRKCVACRRRQLQIHRPGALRQHRQCRFRTVRGGVGALGARRTLRASEAAQATWEHCCRSVDGPSAAISISPVEARQLQLKATVKVATDKHITRKYLLAIKTEEFVSADGKKLSVPSVTLSDIASADFSSGADVTQDAGVPLWGIAMQATRRNSPQAGLLSGNAGGCGGRNRRKIALLHKWALFFAMLTAGVVHASRPKARARRM